MNAARRASLSGAKNLGKAGKGGLDLIKRGATTGTALGKKGFKAASKGIAKLKESRTSRSRLKNSACWKETKRIAALDPKKLAQFDPGELGRLNNIYNTSKCGKKMSATEKVSALLSGASNKSKTYKKYLKKVVEENIKRQNKNEVSANDKVVRKNTGGKYQDGKDLFLKF